MRFVDRRFAALEFLQFGGVGIDARDIVAQIGEAGACYRANIPRSDYRDPRD
jgi:hypothetical protein